MRELCEDIAIKRRLPVNKSAALIISKGGGYYPKLNQNKVKEIGDTKIRPEYIIRPRFGTEFPIFKELVNLKYGSMKVLGLSLERQKRWVVYCECGIYSFRAAKSIKNALRNNLGDSCQACMAVHKQRFTSAPILTEIPPHRTEAKSIALDETKAFLELVGIKVGKLTVLGLSTERNSSWVVKCDCGKYTFRTARTIRKRNSDSACDDCDRQNKYLKEWQNEFTA